MPLSPIEYLRHIRDEAKFLIAQSEGLGREQFFDDEITKRAFVRSLEIIGEAAKKVPAEFKQRYSQVEWRGMTGMRDRLIHGYIAVDYDIVWQVLTDKVPILLEQIEAILRQETAAPPGKKRKKK